MSTSTLTIVQVEAAGPTQVPLNTASQPPIYHFFQLATKLIVLAANALSHSLRSAWSLLSYGLNPVGSLLATLSTPILYLLSPAFLLVNLLANIFIFQPYQLLVLCMHALYPVYAFLFIAVVVAAAIGFCARLGTYGSRLVLLSETQHKEIKPAGESQTAPEVDQTRKKVHIKEEDNARISKAARRRN